MRATRHDARLAQPEPAAHPLLDGDLRGQLPLGAERRDALQGGRWAPPRRRPRPSPAPPSPARRRAPCRARPRVPSCVTMATVCERRLPSIGLKTRSRVSPPTTMSTRLPRRDQLLRQGSRAAPPRGPRRSGGSWSGAWDRRTPCRAGRSRRGTRGPSPRPATRSPGPPGPGRTRGCRPILPGGMPDGSTKCRRRRNSRSAGIWTATNCPGCARSAISGATIVREWYAPILRVDRTSARTRFTRAAPRGSTDPPRRRRRRSSVAPVAVAAAPRRGTPGSSAAPTGAPRSASMPRTAANTPGSVVMHGTPAAADAVRMK